MKKFLVVLAVLFFGCNKSLEKPNDTVIENVIMQNNNIGDQVEEIVKYQETISFVNSFSGLNMRLSPDVSSEKIILIPNNSEVLIIETSERSDIIDGVESKWYKIKYMDYIGWVFWGYLSKKMHQKS